MVCIMVWIKPDMNKEMLAFFETSQKLGISLQKLSLLFCKGKLQQLPNNWWENINLSQLDNTNTIDEAISYAKDNNNDYESILKAFKNNSYIQAPILFKQAFSDDYYCVAGKARLILCKGMKIKPIAYILEEKTINDMVGG